MWPFSKRYGGLVAGHRLHKWWGSLSEAERALVRKVTSQAFSAFNDFDSGPARTLQTTKAMLVSLAAWFEKDELRPLGHAIMQQAESCADEPMDVLDLHFMHHGRLKFYYRCRNDGPEYLPQCEAACKAMILLAPQAAAAFRASYAKADLPTHLGYGRLCWLMKKRGDPAHEALRTEGEKAGWVVSI